MFLYLLIEPRNSQIQNQHDYSHKAHLQNKQYNSAQTETRKKIRFIKMLTQQRGVISPITFYAYSLCWLICLITILNTALVHYFVTQTRRKQIKKQYRLHDWY